MPPRRARARTASPRLRSASAISAAIQSRRPVKGSVPLATAPSTPLALWGFAPAAAGAAERSVFDAPSTPEGGVEDVVAGVVVTVAGVVVVVVKTAPATVVVVAVVVVVVTVV